MKTKVFLLAAAGLVVSAVLLLPPPADPAVSSAVEPRLPTKTTHRSPLDGTRESGHAERLEDSGDSAETENLSAWQERLRALEAELGGREPAIRALLQEIDATYRAWVADQVSPVAGLPPADRYDELADIETSVTEGTAAILEQLGVEESRHLTIITGPSEAIAAETQYAEAAGDSAARLALLRLDRERQVRLEQALAIADEAARSQAVAELDAWYDQGLGGIFTPAEP
jgi:hypothetical protein